MDIARRSFPDPAFPARHRKRYIPHLDIPTHRGFSGIMDNFKKHGRN